MVNSPLKIIFMGTPEFADVHLKSLLKNPASFSVIAVYTQPDRPRGRGKKPIPSPVKVTAQNHNIKVIQEASLKKQEAIEQLFALRPDIIVTVAYGLILPEDILNAARFGAINIHASLLPEYRGPSPIHYTLLNGDPITGVTSFIIEKGVDTGPILLQKELQVDKSDNIISLSQKLADLGSLCLLETLERIKEAGASYKGVPQNNEHATRTKKITKEMGRLSFNDKSEKISNQIKAMARWPGCHISVETNKGTVDLSVIKATAVKDFSDYTKPADIILSGKKVFICCNSKEALEILEVKPAGKKNMTMKSFLNSRSIINNSQVTAI